MIDHLSIQCEDVAASASFYDAVLATLGFGRVLDFGDVIGFGVPPVPAFWLGPRSTGQGFRESHIAFTSPDRAGVARFFDAAGRWGQRCCTRRNVAGVRPRLLRLLRP